ncbi:sn-glycerol-3-phosphate ABC transporter ATP-binding protein UgpC [Candidatus Sumerlaeota bacterium]|nr:sn-glycerol-3-phosphate ABC transporter ATP-binding protein UgpC [Candidatus Sumerlaeota bacterium]
MAGVLIDRVTKIYPGNVLAVDDASIEVEDKEFLVLVGPSGCGKSTLLRMIAGLEEISRGTISIGDRVVNDVAPKDRDIAMVFQNYALYPHMTVYKNLAYGLQLRRLARSEIDRRVRWAAQILGIEDLLDRKPKALSGGQRQRVAVGRAIVRQPQVFLFDEPLSNLDAKLRVQMRAEIAKLHARLESTMIYVTHDQVEAMTLGNRIAVIQGGAVQQIDAPLAIYDRPANRFVAGFIGSPPMNFFEGRLASENGSLCFEQEGFRVRLDGKIPSLSARSGQDIVLGIRPEHISDARGRPDPGAGREVRARVDVVEPMGAEVYVHLVAGGTTFVARFDSHSPARPEEEIPVVFDVTRAHFFDAKTGAALA